jgi:hypothetical protein
MDGDGNEVGVMERGRGRGEFLAREVPSGRPFLPEQASECLAVSFEPAAATFGVKIVVVPELPFLVRRRGGAAVGQVVDVVAVDTDESRDQVGPEHRRDGRGTSAPVVPRDDWMVEVESLDHGDEVVGEGRLLTGPDGRGM